MEASISISYESAKVSVLVISYLSLVASLSVSGPILHMEVGEGYDIIS
jgi:hypothetical protein